MGVLAGPFRAQRVRFEVRGAVGNGVGEAKMGKERLNVL